MIQILQGVQWTENLEVGFILAGGAVSWLSKKQPIISQSTCEAEFVAMEVAARETVWISLLLRELINCHIVPVHAKFSVTILELFHGSRMR